MIPFAKPYFGEEETNALRKVILSGWVTQGPEVAAFEKKFADYVGAKHVGKPHGNAACFSFHPRKVITTGDGGMITTNDPEMDKKFRLLRQHGMSVPDTKRHSAKEVIFESYDVLGYNYRMTDIQAAVGR